MKRMIIALGTAMVIMFCSILTPVTIHAVNRDCGHNSYIANAYVDPNNRHSTYYHQYQSGNGTNGPIYNTCTVHYYYTYRYPQCSICANIDYGKPSEYPLYTEHENCGVGIISYNH